MGYKEFLATVYEAETKGKVVNVKAKALTMEKILTTKNRMNSKI